MAAAAYHLWQKRATGKIERHGKQLPGIYGEHFYPIQFTDNVNIQYAVNPGFGGNFNGGTLEKTTNDGTSWFSISSPSGDTVTQLYADPNSSTNLICVGKNGGIFFSTNSGTNWTEEVSTSTTTGLTWSIPSDAHSGDQYSAGIYSTPGDTNIFVPSNCGTTVSGSFVPGILHGSYSGGTWTWSIDYPTNTPSDQGVWSIAGSENTSNKSTELYAIMAPIDVLYTSNYGTDNNMQIGIGTNTAFATMSLSVINSSGVYTPGTAWNQLATVPITSTHTNNGTNMAGSPLRITAVPTNTGSATLYMAGTLQTPNGQYPPAVWESTNGGSSWLTDLFNQDGSNLEAGPVGTVAIGGGNWDAHDDWAWGEGSVPSNISVYPGNSNDVLISTDTSAYATTNGGTSWYSVSETPSTDQALGSEAKDQSYTSTINPTSSYFTDFEPGTQNVVAGGSDDGLQYSSNGGITWSSPKETLLTGTQQIQAECYDAVYDTNNDTWYAAMGGVNGAHNVGEDNNGNLNGTGGGIWESTDNGVTWTQMWKSTSDILSIALDPNNSNIMYAAQVGDGPNGGVFATTNLNAGTNSTWTLMGDGIGATVNVTMTSSGTAIASLSIPVGGGGSGYVGTSSEVWINGGGGTGALATATFTGGVLTSINLVNGGSGYTSAPTVMAFTADAPIVAWGPNTGEVANNHPFSIHVIATNSTSTELAVTYTQDLQSGSGVGTATAGVFLGWVNRSTLAATWTDITPGASDYQQNGTVDATRTWSMDMTVDPYNSNIYFLGGISYNNQGGELWESTNSGTSWSEIYSGGYGVFGAYVNPYNGSNNGPQDVYIATQSQGLLISTATVSNSAYLTSSDFSQVSSFPFFNDTRVSFDPNDTSEVWVNTFGAGVFMSTGVVIPGAPSNLSATPGTSSIALTWTDPSNTSNVTGYQIWRSTDNATWGTSAYATLTGATDSTYTDSAPVSGTTYYYEVYAYNSAGDSSSAAGMTCGVATFYAYDGFNYSLNSNWNGSGTVPLGFTGNWTVSGTTHASIVAGLSYTESGSTLTTSGNALKMSNSYTAVDTLSQSVGASGSTLWVGFLFNSYSTSSSQPLAAELDLGTSTNEVEIGSTASKEWYGRVITSSGGYYFTSSATTLSANTTYFVACEIEYTPSTGDVIHMYADPVPGTTPTSAVASVTLPATATQLTSANLVTLHADEADAVTTFDEVRLGATYGAVAPDPKVVGASNNSGTSSNRRSSHDHPTTPFLAGVATPNDSKASRSTKPATQPNRFYSGLDGGSWQWADAANDVDGVLLGTASKNGLFN